MSKGFEFDNKFNTDNAFTAIKFGYDTPILETELNELQEIQNFNRKSLIHKICKSGIIDLVDRDFTGERIVYNPNGERNKIAIAPMRAIINGYELHIRGNYSVYNKDTSIINEYIDIDLGEAPEGTDEYSQYREDLVYLQMYFKEITSDTDTKRYGKEDGESIENTIIDPRVGSETSHRIGLRWKIKVEHDVDFKNWEYGFGYNTFNDYSNIKTDIINGVNINEEIDKVFANASNYIFKGCNFYGDNNLWVAGRPDKDNSSNTKDYNLVFAIPLYKVVRRNKQAYSLRNPNGSIDFNNSNKNLRPDSKCYDMIYDSDIVDLRKNVIINNNDIEYYLDNTLSKVFDGNLTTKSNKRMRRIQFGVKPTPLDTPNLIFSDSFDISGKPRLGDKPIITTRNNDDPIYVPHVTDWGLNIDGNIELEYNILNLDSYGSPDPTKNINPNQGTVEFFITPKWNSFDNTNQFIFALKDNMGHPFITMEKEGDQLSLKRYHDYKIEGVLENPIPEPLYLHSDIYPLLAKKIYHIRIIWDANSSLKLNKFAIYINGKFIAETVAFDMQTLMNVIKLQVGKIEDLIDDNTGFVIDELNIYNKCLFNNQWTLPEDYLKGNAIIMPSLNGTLRNFRDNQYEQKHMIMQKTILDGDSFTINAPYNNIFGEETPKIYCLISNNESIETGYEINGMWQGLNTDSLTFALNDSNINSFNGEKVAIEFSIVLSSGSNLDDIPNEILKSEIYNYDLDIAKEVSFNIENNTNELNEPREVPALLTTTINSTDSNYSGRRYLFDMKDRAYDFSTFRNEQNKDFSFVRLLDYYVTGNGTNQFTNIPSELYGYEVLYVRNIYYLDNTAIDNTLEKPINIKSIEKLQYPNDPSKTYFNIITDKVMQNGDKIKLELALGGLTFDYNNISKTFVGNICKAKYLEFEATGDDYVYTIPTNKDIEGICNNGVILSLGTMYNHEFDNKGNEIISSDYQGEYICFRNNKLYKYEYIDGIGKPFLKLRISQIIDGVESEIPVGEKIQIPVFLTYQPTSENILSVWYNYIPYQGVLTTKPKRIKRISQWKYFITTFSSANENDKFNKAYSLSNIINHLPGGSISSSFITGQDICLKNYNLNSYEQIDDYNINKKIIFISQTFIGTKDDDIDKYFFDLKSEYEIKKEYNNLQDDKININNKDYKIYLPSCETPINKYCGMASIVMDQYGDLYLFVVGATNKNIASISNTISPEYGDLFIIPYRPNLINRN